VTIRRRRRVPAVPCMSSAAKRRTLNLDVATASASAIALTVSNVFAQRVESVIPAARPVLIGEGFHMAVVIYAPYVRDTAVTFEIDPPLPADMSARIETATRTHAWVVLQDRGRVVGHAYGGPYKGRPAYRWACEVSVYLEGGRRRTGAGRALYDALFVRLAARRFRTVVGG
jgi:hypothetical protein